MVINSTERPNTLTGYGVLRGMARLMPICVFVVPFGIAFGVAATAQGLGPAQTTAMSAFVFTATAQFAALEFLYSPIAYASLGIVAVALSSRHIIMGAALSSRINQLPVAKRLATLLFLSDANFADTQTLLQRGETDLGPLLGGGFMLWITWVGSTAAGAFGGNLLPGKDAYGFGVVMVCFFAATAFGMVRKSRSMIVPVSLAMGVSALTHPVLPAGWNIIAAAILGGAISLLTDAE